MQSATEYPAHAFHARYHQGRASGTLQISAQGIAFAGAGQQVRFPLAGAQFKLGGASHRLVFVTHPDYPDWTLYTSDRAILKHPQLSGVPLIQQQLASARNRRHFNWAVLVLVVILVLAVPAFLLLRMDSLSGLVAAEVPAAWEDQLGKTVFAQYRIEQTLLESPQAAEDLASLTEPLVQALDSPRYQFRFHVSGDAAINAFALPGGHVVINAGLILAADNAEELLGVLAHEMSHVSEQHGLRNVIGATGIFVVVQALVGDAGGLLATLSSAAPLLLNQRYSRGFESEADVLGLSLLEKAHIDPRGMLTFFEKIRRKEQEQLARIENEDARALAQGTLAQEALGFLSSHPATDARIEQLRARMGSPGEHYRDLNPAFLRLKALAGELVTHVKP